MATISTVSSGNWSDPNIWNLGRIPADLDDVIISNGHTVIFDVWMDDTNFPNGLNSLKINGTSQTTILKASRTTNTRLKFYGSIYGSSRTYSIFDWGKEDDCIPSGVQAEIVKNQTGKYVDGNYLKIYLYGADPGEIATTAEQYASAGSTTIYVNVPENFYLQAGDEILIEVEYKNDYACIKVVQSFNPDTGEIILDSALPYDVDVGNYVLKLTRNLKLIDLVNDANNNILNNCYVLKWGNFYCKVVRFLGLSGVINIKKAVFVNPSGQNQLNYYSSRLWYKDSVFINYLLFWISSFAYLDNCFLNRTQISITFIGILNEVKIFNVYRAINITVGSVYCKNIKMRNLYYLIYNLSGNLIIKNADIKKFRFFIEGTLFGKSFIYSDDDISSLVPELFLSDGTISETYFLTKGINTDNFVLFNRYGKGLKNTTIKRSLDYSVQFKLLTDISGTENPFMYLDFPLTAAGDYTLSIYAQRDSSNTNAKIQVIEEETDNIVAESNTLSDVNVWEALQVRYNFKKDKQYKIRLYAEGLGNVYWDVNPNDERFFQKQIEIFLEKILFGFEIIELPSEEFEVIEIV